MEPTLSAPIQKKKYRDVLGKAHNNIWAEYLDHQVPALHGPAQDRRWVEWLKEQIHLVELA